MASLTPHRDAVERAHRQMLAGTANARTCRGRAGVAARLVVAVQAALTAAIADEFDAGSPLSDIHDGVVVALSNAIGGVAGTIVGSLDTREAILFAQLIVAETLKDLPRVIGPTRTSAQMSACANVDEHQAGHA